MIPNRPLRVFFLLLALAPLPTAGASPPEEPEDGVVVEEVLKDSPAERAGLRPGDLLLSWSRGEGNGGPVRSSFELLEIQAEQAPRGEVTLQGRREGTSREWLLPPRPWGVLTRPTLPQTLLSLYIQARNLLAAGDFEAGTARWRSAIEIAERRQDLLTASWLQARLALQLAKAKRWSEADAAREAAIQRLEGSHPAAAAEILRDGRWFGAFVEPLQLWERDEVDYRRALALAPEESLAAALDLNALGILARNRGDYPAAEDLFRKAYAIQAKLAPGSIALAWTLRELAWTARFRGDIDAAHKSALEALNIQERLAPESLEIMILLLDVGIIAQDRGDLDTAEERFRRALTLSERLILDDAEVAAILPLRSLGLLAMDRGDLAMAEDYFRRALALRESLQPENPETGTELHALGRLAEKRGDLASAEEHYRRALEIWEKSALGPHFMGVRVYQLYTLSAIEKLKGNLAKADEPLQRVQEIQDEIMPESQLTTETCFHRATLAVERGDLILAEEMHGRALAILEKLAPEGLSASDHVEGLGTIAFERGDLTKARELFQRALVIREKMAPGSTRVGLSLNQLGRIDRREGHLARAAEHFCHATEAFDQQRKKLGGTMEGRAAFGGTTAEPYHDCLAALIDLGHLKDAFRVLERGHARSFLDLLAERDLRWTADLPPDLARERKLTDAEYDRTQAALDRLSPVRDQAEVDRLLVRLRELRVRQEEIAAKVRQTSPRAAALQDPQPLDLAGARAALDPGTLLLAWSIGRDRSFLFVVQPAGTDPGLEAFPLSLSDQDLRRRVESFRNLLLRADADRGELSRQAGVLYNALFRPAEARIAAAQRILVSPDGPLHTLPFAALVRDGHWLAEQKPIHTVLSATVYAELKKSRRQGPEAAPAALAAFGDPHYPPMPPGRSSTVHPEVRAAVGRGLSLTSLPSTRDEVRGIASLYPEARTFLGAEATEERAKSIGKDARYLHFACHGLLDERFPLNSALALTIPEHSGEGQDNGLLQAWEIFESVRLDADLVTLSACDSALGQEMGGEGLLGLTRAFQYAGARSVLASLWSVSDASTAELMKSFYGYLQKGRSKDEALRAAQADLIQGKSFSHPYYWAAFELTGDWR
jgi:CHAT domain-containing protein/Flp pilus assembly protein TadD